MTTLILILAAFVPPPTAPRVDEGDRWESATMVRIYGGDPEARIIFWRRDAFGTIHPAGNVGAGELISWTTIDTGVEFFWHDYVAGCYRVLRVPWLFFEDVDRRLVSFQWPVCRNQNVEGFLPNPEKRE